ncbi:MAG: capsule biosynthesis protein [Hyphomicrobiaceae bacterium]
MNQITLMPVGRPLDAPSRRRRRFSWPRQSCSFLIVVALPTLLAGVYYALIAADRYEAVSQFVIRSPSNTTTSQIASLVQGSTIVRSSDDAFIVQAYLASRDIVRTLVDTAELGARLARPEADFFWRYPSPFFAHNEERLFKHMQSLASVEYDFSTGIMTLRVQAFRPEDSKAIAEAMLVASEGLINRLSDRAQTNAISAAEQEVEQSRARAREVQTKITHYRNTIGMIDPGRVSAAALETIARLALESAQTSAQIAEIEKSSPQSTQIAALRHRKAALDDQILREQARLAGSGTSLAPMIAEYERLTLERSFAERTAVGYGTAEAVSRAHFKSIGAGLPAISETIAWDYCDFPRQHHALRHRADACWRCARA